MSLGKAVKYLRNIHLEKSGTLADHVGMAASLVSQLERNYKPATRGTIEKIAKHFNVAVSEFYALAECLNGKTAKQGKEFEKHLQSELLQTLKRAVKDYKENL